MKAALRFVALFMAQKTEDSRHLFFSFGMLTIIGYPLFYLMNITSEKHNYENLALRALAVFLGILLILHDKWPAKLDKFKPLYWYFSTTFILPFFFTFMLLKNPTSVEWQLNALIIITLTILLFDWISTTFITIIGIITGAVVYYISDSNPQLPKNLGALINAIMSLLIYCALFSHKKEAIQYKRKVRLEVAEQVNVQLEQKVKERTDRLEKALAAKTEFLNNMSHEIRTPIQGFTVLSDGLVRCWSFFDDQKKLNLAVQVADNANRLATLLNNLLDLSKFNADKMIMDFEVVDLNVVIDNIIDECQSLYLNKKSIEIQFNRCKKSSSMIDEKRIDQVLRNLFVNAIKFSKNNSIIIASLENINEELLFTITDTGVGIPIEELETIFEPFTQSSRTKTAAGGTGLGLSICRQIIEGHHGKIWATNNIDIGSSFHFIIPVKQ